MDLLRDVGAVAGLAAFLGLAVLALLYFAQARDVRRLRENAEFLVEGEPSAPTGGDTAAVPTAVTAPADPEAAARTAAATAPNEAEAFRRAELARQAAERRQRFESRRSGDEGRFGSRVPSTAIIAIGALILIAGIIFGATQLLGGDDSETPGKGDKNASTAACPGGTKIAVLNGTAEPGLAGTFSKQLKDRNYQTGQVTNTETAFESSTVMFDAGNEACADEVAQLLSIQGTEPMDQEVRRIGEAPVAVILGEDRATGSGETGTETSGTLGG
jgi:hypothetical protein